MNYLYESQTLGFQRLQAHDEQSYINLYTCPELTQYIGGPLDEKKANRAFLSALKKSSQHNPNYLIISITLKMTNDFVGIIGLTQIDPIKKTADIGIILARRHQRKRLSVPIYLKSISFAFRNFSINKLYSRLSPQNKIMEMLALRTGFKMEANESNDHQNVYSVTPGSSQSCQETD